MNQNEYQLEIKKLFEEIELNFNSSFEIINVNINSIICDLENNLDQQLKCNNEESIDHQQDIILPISYLRDIQNEQLSLELTSLTKLYKDHQVNQVKISFNQQLEKQASLQQQQIEKYEMEKRQLEDLIKSKDQQLQSKNSDIQQLQKAKAEEMKKQASLQQEQIKKQQIEKRELEISRKYERKNEGQIVLIGFIGSGKTSLFNLMCKTKQPIQGCTKQTLINKAAYGSGFLVLDTPGYGSYEDKIIHAVGILNALSEGPVSQIFLVVRFERVAIITRYLKQMIVIFRRYRHLITVAVTHWDTNENEETKKANEKQIVQLCKTYGINSVIFVSKFDTGEKVCAQIDSILDKCQAEKIELTESEFYSNFDLIELKEDVEKELEFSKEDVQFKFHKITNAIRKFIKEFDDNDPLVHDIMHQLTFETKKIAKNLISDFELKNNDKFSKLFEYHKNPSLAYLVHFELKKALMVDIEEIVKLTQQKMINNEEHFFNFIKACPQCGLIWLKVAGSCTLTQCGQFPEVDDNFFEKQKILYRFEFNISEKGVNYTLLQDDTKLQKPVKRYAKPKNLLGCGYKFVWDDLPIIGYEITDPGIMDYFANEYFDWEQKELEKTLKKSQESLHSQIEQIKQKYKVIKL